MGDTFKSEIQKPINNPLLSGAGHGFPFDIFQGSSLLVPVSQENSSVLGDQVGEPDRFVGQDNVSIGTIHNLSDSLDATAEAKIGQNGDSQPASNSQSYVKLFTSFFGNSQTKPEAESSQAKTTKKNDEPISAAASSVSSTPRSYSPYVNIPNFQTVTPALQVPSVATSTALEGNPLDSFCSAKHPPYPHQNPAPTEGFARSGAFSEVDLRDPRAGAAGGDKCPPRSGFVDPFGMHAKEQTKQAASLDSYFTKTDSDIDLCGVPNPFPGTLGNYQSPAASVQKQEHSLDLSAPATQNTSTNPSFSSAPQMQNVQISEFQQQQQQQHRTNSSKSVDVNKPPLTNPNAPPLVSGGSSKNYRLYRLSHHKKPVYAPIPGLSITAQTSTSSTFLPTGEVSSLPSMSSSSFPGVPSSPLINPNVNHPLPPAEDDSNPKSNVIPEQTAPSAASFFSSSFASSKNPIQSSFLQSRPSEINASGAASVPVSLTSGASLPYPYPAVNNESQNLFAPISKANSEASPEVNHSVLNPVAMHPGNPAPVPLSSQTVNPKTVEEKVSSPVIIPPSLNHLAHVGRTGIAYRPPYHHWFYKKDIDSKEFWYPFSMTDSVALEQSYQSGRIDENTVIPTDGGRYDVNVLKRTRIAVYWKESPKEVRRCSWFYKNSNESRYRPYGENISYKLEEEYKKCITTNSWRKKVEINPDEYIIINSANNITHLDRNFPVPDGWDDLPDGSQHIQAPVKSVKRGISDDFDIDDGEASKVDHLVFVVHGIGSVCDLKFRTIEEAVDVFRSASHQLIKSHFGTSVKQGLVNRVEILPVSWHSELHGETTGLDKKLESITLKSIPRLRNFTNDTLLDILFYTSPVYCQNIVNQVSREITNIYEKFKLRNPYFNGGVSLVGHSLGSLILFDMLCHQKPSVPVSESRTVPTEVSSESKSEHEPTRRLSGFVMGNAGTGQPYIEYPQLSFQPLAFFALGSPIGMFVTIRGIKLLGLDFHFPTCARFFNIFHPFDPVAYRIEALINPELADKRPFLIPHHKGRKRMHLELRDTINRVGADLKQRLVDSIRSTWNTVYQLTALGRADDGLEQEVDKVIEKQIERQRSESVASCISEQENLNCNMGCLNMGRRIDCVLQEAPLESFNEYVSAIRSHLIYWDSEDTVLMILKEIYNASGISVDINPVSSQEISENNSPPSPPSPSLSAFGWNVPTGQTVNSKMGPEFQAPSVGFMSK